MSDITGMSMGEKVFNALVSSYFVLAITFGEWWPVTHENAIIFFSWPPIYRVVFLILMTLTDTHLNITYYVRNLFGKD